MPFTSSQYVWLSAALARSNSRASQLGIWTPLKPSAAAQPAMAFRLLNGGASPANCTRNMAGPLIDLIARPSLVQEDLRREEIVRQKQILRFAQADNAARPVKEGNEGRRSS